MKHNPEVAALNDLLTTLNNPDIVGVTPVDQRGEVETTKLAARLEAQRGIVMEEAHAGPKIETTKSPPIETSLPEPPLLKEAWVAPYPALAPAKKAVILSAGPFVGPQKLFFTGRLKSGKDHAAACLDATILGFADPIYAIAAYYFGVEVSSTVGKDTPGVRAFLQTVGQWGRGITSEQYPLTVPRALFIDRVRTDGSKGSFGFPEVAWDTYGHNGDIWLDACIARANTFLESHPKNLVAITNCRFNNEFKKLTEEGFQHWHVMVSPATWAKRLAASQLTMESPAVKDTSEQLASSLDSNVIKQLSAAKNGAKLRCLWNDDVAPVPSTRLHSLTTFLQSVKGA